MAKRFTPGVNKRAKGPNHKKFEAQIPKKGR